MPFPPPLARVSDLDATTFVVGTDEGYTFGENWSSPDNDFLVSVTPTYVSFRGRLSYVGDITSQLNTLQMILFPVGIFKDLDGPYPDTLTAIYDIESNTPVAVSAFGVGNVNLDFVGDNTLCLLWGAIYGPLLTNSNTIVTPQDIAPAINATIHVRATFERARP